MNPGSLSRLADPIGFSYITMVGQRLMGWWPEMNSLLHVSAKILDEFANVMGLPSQLNRGNSGFLWKVGYIDPLATIKNFNWQFQLGKNEQSAVE